jgi:hypothetical protein
MKSAGRSYLDSDNYGKDQNLTICLGVDVMWSSGCRFPLPQMKCRTSKAKKSEADSNVGDLEKCQPMGIETIGAVGFLWLLSQAEG